MGAKKTTDGEQDNNVAMVLKVDMHCDGCATKITRFLRAFPGVEKVKTEGDAGKITVTGKVDPTNVRDSLAEKIKKKVELISPQPKKEKEKEKEKENKDTKQNNQSEKKTDDKKTKEKEAVTTAVLKMALHCQGCLDKIGKTVLKTKGVQEMSIDKEKETVTIKGTMDVKALVGILTEKLKRKVEVVPPKKDKDGDKEGAGGDKKKNKGGGGDSNEKNESGEEKLEQSRMEYSAPAFGFGYGYGNFGSYNYGQVYPEQLHFHLHAQPPQMMFSDENPNACSVM